MEIRKVPVRKDGRVIIHFDYDCFYAAVFEVKNPSLRSLPLAIQQKHIIATCNYEARRRGLYKLMLLKDAKRMCPDLIVELGEDLTRFRDASKENYNFIKEFSWSGKIERLGFDEVWMDVTDMVDYNMEIINRNDLEHSFFQLSREDPTNGFEFDATSTAGHIYPKDTAISFGDIEIDSDVGLRLGLGSHLAMHMRHQLEYHKGYTSTVGIATNKLLSKLVGSMNKPKGQTTLMPPLESNAQTFMDDHDIGKVPGIGFKLSQKLREFILHRPAEFEFIYGGSKENVTVAQVRNHPEVNSEKLEELLGGPGSPQGIGYKVWCLLHGVDDTEVSQARPVPTQISIEDSYRRLDTFADVWKELLALTKSLIKRMRTDLLGEEDDFDEQKEGSEIVARDSNTSSLSNKKWLAHPKTLRLSIRPKQPLQVDGTRARTMKRISHSCPLPNFVFDLNESVEAIAERLVRETIITMFRKLNPDKAGWDLSLVNIAVTNMAEAAGESKTASGRDIGNMFKRQDDVLKDFRVTDTSPWPPMSGRNGTTHVADHTDLVMKTEHTTDLDSQEEAEWDEDDGMYGITEYCPICSSHIPAFAMVAHSRFHTPSDS